MIHGTSITAFRRTFFSELTCWVAISRVSSSSCWYSCCRCCWRRCRYRCCWLSSCSCSWRHCRCIVCCCGCRHISCTSRRCCGLGGRHDRRTIVLTISQQKETYTWKQNEQLHADYFTTFQEEEAEYLGRQWFCWARARFCSVDLLWRIVCFSRSYSSVCSTVSTVAHLSRRSDSYDVHNESKVVDYSFLHGRTFSLCQQTFNGANTLLHHLRNFFANIGIVFRWSRSSVAVVGVSFALHIAEIFWHRDICEKTREVACEIAVHVGSESDKKKRDGWIGWSIVRKIFSSSALLVIRCKRYKLIWPFTD